jgi:hypothetical protein
LIGLTRNSPSPISPHEAAARKTAVLLLAAGKRLIANPSNKKRLLFEGQNREQKT